LKAATNNEDQRKPLDAEKRYGTSVLTAVAAKDQLQFAEVLFSLLISSSEN
jgi:hypothetical protein